MPDYCPSCGSKVEKEHKFCLGCGAQLQSEEQQIPIQPQKQPTIQGSNISSMQPKKSNKILFISLIAIIALVIIVVLVVLLFTGGGVIDNRFVGEWEQYDGEFITIDWNFKNDGSLEIMSMDLATWNVKGNQLCIDTNEFWDQYMPEETFDEVCYDFEFSDSGNTLTLSINGSEYSVLTKK